MKEISINLKRTLFKRILEEESPFGEAIENEGIIKFIERIWDIDIPSSNEFDIKNIRGNLYQHTVRNNDWTDQYVFEDILKLYEDNNNYIKFLEELVSPETRITHLIGLG